MAELLRESFLALNRFAYSLARPLIFRQSAQQAHQHVIELLARLDDDELALALIRATHALAFEPEPVHVGGVALPIPAILAAGFVKGPGFTTQAEAMQAAQTQNIMPGWRVMPALVGPVEFGSFTPQPRLGNPGTVMWRRVRTESTQNRVGLKNPGAAAAATFLARNPGDLPAVYGINIAPSPGTDDPEKSRDELLAAFSAFIDRGVLPAWFTLNLSCPNTEDDPGSQQTEKQTRLLCRALITLLNDTADETGVFIPLWVKISPDLAPEQLSVLMRVFHEEGISAVVATNTLGQPTPDASGLTAGVGGGDLRPHALRTVQRLLDEKAQHRYDLDIIACGGVITPAHFMQYQAAGCLAVQYWSALVYRGPLAAAFILNESRKLRS